MTDCDVIVVGGGIAGLNCARELARRGRHALVLEAAPAVGGRIATEEVAGYRLDRGFAVLQTAYPELPRALNLDALDLRAFEPGALVRWNGRFHRLADPWRRPLSALTTLFSPLGTFGDKLRMAALRRRTLASTLDDLYARGETTDEEYLRSAGFSNAIVERFFRPFFAGVFFDPALSVSSRAFEFCFRAFAAGDTAVPAAGMGAIPAQLAAALPDGTVRTAAPVVTASARSVTLAGGERLRAEAVVIATDARAAAQLLGEEPPPTRCTTCIYFAAERAPLDEPVLMLNAEGAGPVNSVVVPSLLSRAYAPAGDALIAVNVFGSPEGDDETLTAAVRAQLRGWFGAVVNGWRHLKTQRIADALPLQTPPVADPRRGNAQCNDGLYVCGEYRNAPTIQWALYSGRRAAGSIAGETPVDA